MFCSLTKPEAAWPRRRGDRVNMSRRDCITLLGSAVAALICVSAAAQEGHYGVGHDKWHRDFYSTLKRNDGKGPCCSLIDCGPARAAQRPAFYCDARH